LVLFVYNDPDLCNQINLHFIVIGKCGIMAPFEPLLSTKLYIPKSRPDLVPRHRLIERLNQGVDRKLTLISAPAGFGKTTLLSDWVRQSNKTVAWVSLDQGDNDQTSFLVYLVAALHSILLKIRDMNLTLISVTQIESSPED
jgi:LuxR family maltose regulon positive regulatory protein